MPTPSSCEIGHEIGCHCPLLMRLIPVCPSLMGLDMVTYFVVAAARNRAQLGRVPAHAQRRQARDLRPEGPGRRV